jgi:hypothetical protein
MTSSEPKPKIEGYAETHVLTNFDHTFRKVISRTDWLVSCACQPNRGIALVPSWDAALEIALLHGRKVHDAHP